MTTFKTSKQVFEECQRDGYFKLQEEIDLRVINSMANMAIGELGIVQELNNTTIKNVHKANTIFKLQYDVFRELVDSFIRFDKIKILNHHCLFAYLIEKHGELELDWNVLEEVRTKRNGIQYYGTSISVADWKRLELPLFIYINTLRKAIDEKLNQEKSN